MSYRSSFLLLVRYNAMRQPDMEDAIEQRVQGRVRPVVQACPPHA
jgi:hypothetical protein